MLQPDTSKLQFLEKKLKLSEDKNLALTSLLGSKDEELDKSYQQRGALSSLFENDLSQMTDKLIQSVVQVRSQDDLSKMEGDLKNLQKLIAVSFQAMKGGGR